MKLEIEKEIQLHKKSKLRDVISAMDRLAVGIALIVDDEGRLAGVFTDGDTRRAILKNIDLNCPIEKVMTKNPVTATEDFTRKQMLHLIQCRAISHLPVVDSQNRVVKLVFASDFMSNGGLPVKAMVMAGGLGTRLRPLTDNTPKPLLKVGSRSVLDVIVTRLQEAGIEDVYLSVRYKSEQIEKYFGNGDKWGVRIKYLKEEKRLGTAGAISLIQENFDEPLLIINGDILTKVDFKRIVEFHRQQEADMTVAVKQHEVEVPFGVVEVREGELTGLSEKPLIKFFINAGIYVLDAGLRAKIPYNTYFDMTELIDLATRDRKKILTFPIREYWIDIGGFSDYEKAINEFEDHFES